MKYGISVRVFLKFLKWCGFRLERQRGSHAIYSNGKLKHVLTMEKRTHTYSQGHLKIILKNFSLTIERLNKFLKRKI